MKPIDGVSVRTAAVRVGEEECYVLSAANISKVEAAAANDHEGDSSEPPSLIETSL